MTLRDHNVRDGIVYPRPAGSWKKGSTREQRSTGQFSLPAHMYRAIPEGSAFKAEWHEEGILYRFIGTRENHSLPCDPTPDWASGIE